MAPSASSPPATLAAPPAAIDLSLLAIAPDQIVLRGLSPAWVEPSLSSLWSPASDRYPPRSLRTDLQGLIDLLTEVRSPASGWDAQFPQTPENLLPYVSEEANEVLTGWDRWCQSRPAAPARTELPTLATFLATGLWQLASHSPRLMQHLGGFPGRVFQPGDTWQGGQLRVLALVTIATATTQYTVDMVTQRPPRSRLSRDSLVQIGAEPPQWIGAWLETYRLERPSTQPITALWQQPLQVEWLEPGANWQAAQMSLTLGLEFQADAIADSPDLGQIVLQDEDWRNALHSIHLQHRILTDCLPTLSPAPGLDSAEATGMIPPERTARLHQLLAMIESALATDPAAVPALGAPLSLTTVMDQLRWLLMRCHPAIARLLGGLPARYLEPGQPWRSGYVRLRATLDLQAQAGQGHTWDLSGAPQPLGFTPAATGVVELCAPDLPRSPRLATAFLGAICQDIDQSGAELEGWLHGTAIAYYPPSQNALSQATGWEGHLNLTLALEFCPAG